MNKPRLLFVDDKIDELEDVIRILEFMFDVTRAQSFADIRRMTSRDVDLQYSVAVIDMAYGTSMPEISDPEWGLSIAAILNQMDYPAEIVVFTAYPSISNASKCMQAGAFAYIEKGLSDSISILEEMCKKAYQRWLQRVSDTSDRVAVGSEAIVIIDIVESTETSIIYGWNAVGKSLIHDVREIILQVGKAYNMGCSKFTGDGYLVTFVNSEDASLSVLQALRAISEIARRVAERNTHLPKQLRLRLRYVLHFGEVDIIRNDREGLEVSFAFRLETMKGNNVQMSEQKLPEEDYAILSNRVTRLLRVKGIEECWTSLGSMSFKGFDGTHEVSLVSDVSSIAAKLTPSPAL